MSVRPLSDCDKLPPPPPDLLVDASLFLDFDGTLVEIADRPDAIRVEPGLGRLIARLAAALSARLAIISGRSVTELTAYLRPACDADPRPALAGNHGLELLWPDGRHDCPAAPGSLHETIAEAHALAQRLPGVVIEQKPFGVAFHYRQAPEAHAAIDAIAMALAARGDFVLQRGKMVHELRAIGPDKGDAMRRLLATSPMVGTRPIFVGDDLTDESGFLAARAAGGAGVLVGYRAGTAASYALPDVAAVHRWLSQIAEGSPA